jgi:hypothetical protein
MSSYIPVLLVTPRLQTRSVTKPPADVRETESKKGAKAWFSVRGACHDGSAGSKILAAIEEATELLRSEGLESKR